MKKILAPLSAALVVALGYSAPADAHGPGLPDRWVNCVQAPCP